MDIINMIIWGHVVLSVILIVWAVWDSVWRNGYDLRLGDAIGTFILCSIPVLNWFVLLGFITETLCRFDPFKFFDTVIIKGKR